MHFINHVLFIVILRVLFTEMPKIYSSHNCHDVEPNKTLIIRLSRIRVDTKQIMLPKSFYYTHMASASLDVPPRSRSAGEATKQVAPEKFNKPVTATPSDISMRKATFTTYGVKLSHYQ